MVKVAIDAGHGFNTPGKRSPTPYDEREWMFNDKVVRAAIHKLNMYDGVSILRVDDPTGKVDTPLVARTNQANRFKADVYISVHHNALRGVWGDHGGVETFTYDHPRSNPESVRIAHTIHSRVVQAMGLRDRGLKKANFHVLRETNMPSVLIEGGFMDSRTDILALRDDKKLQAQGEAIAEGLAVYFGLKVKGVQESYRLLTGTFGSKASAEHAAEKLRKEFGWIVYIKEE